MNSIDRIGLWLSMQDDDIKKAIYKIKKPKNHGKEYKNRIGYKTHIPKSERKANTKELLEQ